MLVTSKEKRLIKQFLEAYKSILKDRTDIPFHPRSLSIISQPNMQNENEFDWISYNNYFDDIDIGVYQGKSRNIVEAFLEMPINILITAEELGKPLLSEKDQIKLAKALQLIGEIDIRRV